MSLLKTWLVVTAVLVALGWWSGSLAVRFVMHYGLIRHRSLDPRDGAVLRALGWASVAVVIETGFVGFLLSLPIAAGRAIYRAVFG